MTITSGLISPKIDYPPNISRLKNKKKKYECIYRNNGIHSDF